MDLLAALFPCVPYAWEEDDGEERRRGVHHLILSFRKWFLSVFGSGRARVNQAY